MNVANVPIPKNLVQQMNEHRKQLGISTRDYVGRALVRFMSTSSADFYHDNGFDADLAEELAEWDRVSAEDFERFAKQHNL